MRQIRTMPEQSIPEGLLLDCKAVGVFPSTISAGIGIGGQYGEGVIVVKDRRGRWSGPAIFTIAGGSIGWQIGGQATDYVMLFMDDESVNAILQGKGKLGVDASATAGPVGRSASAATDIQFKGGILSYSLSRGLFVGAKLEGAALIEHRDGNKGLYGRDVSARDILFDRKVKAPRCARRLIRILSAYNPLVYFLHRAFGK
jgi:lipid-binding SYLF domain-containing protein